MIHPGELMIMVFWLPEQPKHHDHEGERVAARGKAGR
jgi:hypothetical protein